MEKPGEGKQAPVTGQKPWGWKCNVCGEVISRGELVTQGQKEYYWEREKLRRWFPTERGYQPETMWGGIGWSVTGSLMCRCQREAIAWGVEKMGLREGEPWPAPGDERWKLLRPKASGGPLARVAAEIAQEIA